MTAAPQHSYSSSIPASILIVGSGIFGLTTALALTERQHYANTTITVLDPHAILPSSHTSHTASIDTTRIVRADYANKDYARLAQEAQVLWRTEHWGRDGRYSESGLLLAADEAEGAYLLAALENVRQLNKEHEANGVKGCGSEMVEELSSPALIATAMNAGVAAKGTGVSGYINHASGWAHAEACMRHLRSLVEATGRVRFVVGEAHRVMTDSATDRVTGVMLKSGEMLAAEQTILATGSWTGCLVDLRGVASARGECIGYMSISEEEAAALKYIRVLYNMGNGLFFFPPTTKGLAGGGWEIKVAQHTFGYTNPVEMHIEQGLTRDTGEKIRVTLPAFPESGIPPADKERLEKFLLDALPILKEGQHAGESRVLDRSRLCWYLDTASSDWLVCPYPLPTQHSTPSATTTGATYPSLFLATGGSGHAFKFLPVLGQRIVDVLDGTDQSANSSNGLWTRKWAWPGKAGNLREPGDAVGLDSDVKAESLANGEEDGGVWCMDGSRGGKIGLKLFDTYNI